MVITKDSESFDPGSSPGRTSRFFGFFLCSPKPIKPREQFQGLRVHSSAVEHGIADPGVAGSIPAAPLSLLFFPNKKFGLSVSGPCFVPSFWAR